MHIQLLDPLDPAAGRLIALADTYMTSLYPAVSSHLESIAGLQQPNVDFFGGYLDGELMACGAIKVMENDGP